MHGIILHQDGRKFIYAIECCDSIVLNLWFDCIRSNSNSQSASSYYVEINCIYIKIYEVVSIEALSNGSQWKDHFVLDLQLIRSNRTFISHFQSYLNGIVAYVVSSKDQVLGLLLSVGNIHFVPSFHIRLQLNGVTHHVIYSLQTSFLRNHFANDSEINIQLSSITNQSINSRIIEGLGGESNREVVSHSNQHCFITILINISTQLNNNIAIIIECQSDILLRCLYIGQVKLVPAFLEVR